MKRVCNNINETYPNIVAHANLLQSDLLETLEESLNAVESEEVVEAIEEVIEETEDSIEEAQGDPTQPETVPGEATQEEQPEDAPGEPVQTEQPETEPGDGIPTQNEASIPATSNVPSSATSTQITSQGNNK